MLTINNTSTKPVNNDQLLINFINTDKEKGQSLVKKIRDIYQRAHSYKTGELSKNWEKFCYNITNVSSSNFDKTDAILYRVFDFLKNQPENIYEFTNCSTLEELEQHLLDHQAKDAVIQTRSNHLKKNKADIVNSKDSLTRINQEKKEILSNPELTQKEKLEKLLASEKKITEENNKIKELEEQRKSLISHLAAAKLEKSTIYKYKCLSEAHMEDMQFLSNSGIFSFEDQENTPAQKRIKASDQTEKVAPQSKFINYQQFDRLKVNYEKIPLDTRIDYNGRLIFESTITPLNTIASKMHKQYEVNKLNQEIINNCTTTGLINSLNTINSKTVFENKVKDHAQIRLQLFYSMCQVFYRSNVTNFQSIKAQSQMGKGDKALETEACHHSILASVNENFSDQIKRKYVAMLCEMYKNPQSKGDFHLQNLLKALNIESKPPYEIIAEIDKKVQKILEKFPKDDPVQLFENILTEKISDIFSTEQHSPFNDPKNLFHFLNNTTLITSNQVNDTDSLIEMQRPEACDLLKQVASGKLSPLEATISLAERLTSSIENGIKYSKALNESMDKFSSLNFDLKNDESKETYIQEAGKLYKSINDWDNFTKGLHSEATLQDPKLVTLKNALGRLNQDWQQSKKEHDSISLRTSSENQAARNKQKSEMLTKFARNFENAFKQYKNLSIKPKLEYIESILKYQLEGTKTKKNSYEQIKTETYASEASKANLQTLDLNEQIILSSKLFDINSQGTSLKRTREER